jgi:hypothetical protein
MHAAFALADRRLRDLMAEHARMQAAEIARLEKLASSAVDIDRWIASTTRASVVESLFTGMEGVLKELLSVIDGEVTAMAETSRFHAAVLAQAAGQTSSRAPLISESLYRSLDELRRFRHLERNIYTGALNAERVTELTHLVLGVVPEFEAAMRATMARWGDTA